MKTSDYTFTYFIDSFEEAKRTASELTGAVTEAQFFLKPSPKKWCMAEILSHLVQAGGQYQKQIQKGYSQASGINIETAVRFTPNPLVRLFIRSVSPENQVPLPTVPSFEPLQRGELNQEDVLSKFTALQDSFLSSLHSAKEQRLDLDRIMTKNPILKVIPMSLTSCYAVTEAHQRRHFEQMRHIIGIL